MRESLKAVLSLVLIVAVICCFVFWTQDRPDQTTWIGRVSSPLVLIGSAIGIAVIKPRRNLVPDYLAQRLGNYFNRGGFCFNFTIGTQGGRCILNAFFQNQYDQRCLGRIALRPTKGFFLTRARFEAIQFDIDCEPAAFGAASVAIPIPANLQGKKQAFEVGASVEFPDGKGKRLRFADGLLIRSNSNFRNAFGTTLAVAGALGGMIVLSSPATVTLTLPSDVKEELPEDIAPEIHTFWKLHDQPLTMSA